ncbi:hypothetical protein IMCC1989_1347 [gamma proteobacterium IMCC1989]|nr:hypothetical protein IMCC1989_1347 [gamma proteobacterium IMCC1989]
MSAQEFAAQLKETIQGVKDNGTAAIYCDNLIAYLDDVSESPSHTPTEVELEKYKADLQLHIEQNKNYHASQLEMFRSVISSGQNAIRSSFLLNGGASVALLAFIGHLATTKPESVLLFASALMPFVLGVLSMTITSGLTYLGQWLYDNVGVKSQKWGFRVNIACILLGISSYAFFMWGMCRAYYAFINFV